MSAASLPTKKNFADKDRKREPGFYWVQFGPNGGPSVAEWQHVHGERNGYWYFPCDEMRYASHELLWIDEWPLKPRQNRK